MSAAPGLRVDCPVCRKPAGVRCFDPDGLPCREPHALRTATALRDDGYRLNHHQIRTLEDASRDAASPRERIVGLGLAHAWNAIVDVPWMHDHLRCALGAEVVDHAIDRAEAATTEQLVGVLALVMLLRGLTLSGHDARNMQRAIDRAFRTHVSVGAALMRACTWGRS